MTSDPSGDVIATIERAAIAIEEQTEAIKEQISNISSPSKAFDDIKKRKVIIRHKSYKGGAPVEISFDAFSEADLFAIMRFGLNTKFNNLVNMGQEVSKALAEAEHKEWTPAFHEAAKVKAANAAVEDLMKGRISFGGGRLTDEERTERDIVADHLKQNGLPRTANDITEALAKLKADPKKSAALSVLATGRLEVKL